MTAILLRILVLALIFGAIFFGVRRIWRDWQKQFKAEDKAVHQRDLEERKRPDVITLKRDKDGTYRPPDNDGKA
ncbi:MAG: FeoB-associated Cys-rich membrane protein [Devosia sp.]